MSATEKPKPITCIDDFPPPPRGEKVCWKKCRTCGEVYRHTYLPYSFRNPVLWTHCGHSTGHRDLNCDDITEAEADRFFRKRAGNPRRLKPSKKPRKLKKSRKR
jgi:hypothetical protein